jgi:hypothetical protein
MGLEEDEYAYEEEHKTRPAAEAEGRTGSDNEAGMETGDDVVSGSRGDGVVCWGGWASEHRDGRLDGHDMQ